jgi:hypothetical protein
MGLREFQTHLEEMVDSMLAVEEVVPTHLTMDMSLLVVDLVVLAL